MVELTLNRPGDHVFIRGVAPDGFQLGERFERGAVVLSRETVVPGWPPDRCEDIAPEHLEAVFELRPDVVLVGTGRRQRFLDPELVSHFHARDVGVEMMDTRAACRTFNVLAGEGRNVVAALLPVGDCGEE